MKKGINTLVLSFCCCLLLLCCGQSRATSPHDTIAVPRSTLQQLDNNLTLAMTSIKKAKSKSEKQQNIITKQQNELRKLHNTLTKQKVTLEKSQQTLEVQKTQLEQAKQSFESYSRISEQEKRKLTRQRNAWLVAFVVALVVKGV